LVVVSERQEFQKIPAGDPEIVADFDRERRLSLGGEFDSGHDEKIGLLSLLVNK